MRVRLGAASSSALTIGIGLIIILGLLLTGDDLNLPDGFVDLVGAITGIALKVVTITVALMFLVGVGNMCLVHLRRIIGRKKGAIYSVFLLGSFMLALATYATERDDPQTSMVLFETVQVSVESALAGLLFFALVYGAYRMMRKQVTWSSVLFIVALLIVLTGALPFASVKTIGEIRDWMLAVPVSAGARGLLLGIALGTIVTGVRVLIGVDQSYRE
jgi:hypothetical protein